MEWSKDNGFDDFFSKFPQGYMTLLGQERISISGGQKQLVGLARALYRKPSLLLIDEETSAMDSACPVTDRLRNVRKAQKHTKDVEYVILFCFPVNKDKY